jgi:membrane-bound serine protease (ClpP class)
LAGIKNYELKYYTPSAIDRIIGFLLNPVLQGILIMLILGGIYFELQTPGVGFPLALAVTAALLFFAPLYLNELAQSWELIVFIAGVILIALEIFVIPGFGIAGISGIILVVVGLTMSLVDNVRFEYDGLEAAQMVFKALGRVILSLVLAFIISIYISKKLFTTKKFKLALNDVLQTNSDYISVDGNPETLIGKEGIAYTVLRPSGKVEIEGEIYDAKGEIGYIEKGEKVKVIRIEAGQLYVYKV